MRSTCGAHRMHAVLTAQNGPHDRESSPKSVSSVHVCQSYSSGDVLITDIVPRRFACRRLSSQKGSGEPLREHARRRCGHMELHLLQQHTFTVRQVG